MQPQTKAHLLLELLIVGGWCAKQLSPDINSDNKLIEALLNEAIGLREAGKAQLSLQLIDQALALELSSPWFADNRARALLALEQRQEALTIWLQLSREADPLVAEMAVAMLMENSDSTSEQCHEQEDGAGDELGTDQQLQALKAAIQLREDGQLEASLELIDAALAAGETDPWWLDNKARVLVELNNLCEALSIWENIVVTADEYIGQVASEMLAVHGPKLLAPLLNICEQNNWQPLYLAVNNQTILLQLLQELSASREAGEIDLSLKLIAQAKQLGFQSHWIDDNEARALVHLQREAEAVALWRNLESKNDLIIASMAAEMLAIYGPKVERRELQKQAEQFLEHGEPAAAEALLLSALLTDPNHAGCRELLLRTLSAQLGSGDSNLLGTETRERELWLEGHSRLLAQFEQHLGFIGVSS